MTVWLAARATHTYKHKTRKCLLHSFTHFYLLFYQNIYNLLWKVSRLLALWTFKAITVHSLTLSLTLYQTIFTCEIKFAEKLFCVYMKDILQMEKKISHKTHKFRAEKNNFLQGSNLLAKRFLFYYTNSLSLSFTHSFLMVSDRKVSTKKITVFLVNIHMSLIRVYCSASPDFKLTPVRLTRDCYQFQPFPPSLSHSHTFWFFHLNRTFTFFSNPF
jgi:hypothetical protein